MAGYRPGRCLRLPHGLLAEEPGRGISDQGSAPPPSPLCRCKIGSSDVSYRGLVRVGQGNISRSRGLVGEKHGRGPRYAWPVV